MRSIVHDCMNLFVWLKASVVRHGHLFPPESVDIGNTRDVLDAIIRKILAADWNILFFKSQKPVKVSNNNLPIYTG